MQTPWKATGPGPDEDRCSEETHPLTTGHFNPDDLHSLCLEENKEKEEWEEEEEEEEEVAAAHTSIQLDALLSVFYTELLPTQTRQSTTESNINFAV